MQIKPSLLEKPEKYFKPLVPLPPVPKKISPTEKVVSPQNKEPKIDIKKVEKKDIISPPSTAFTKKRSSIAQGEIEKKDLIKVE